MRVPSRYGEVSGFTLIELVISTALMSIILVSAYLCLSSAVASQKLIDTRSEVVQNARVALALMTADFRAACPLSKDVQFVGMHREAEAVAADNVDFGTHNYSPKRLREGDFCEVSYFVEKDPTSGRLSLWRRRDPTPDPEPFAGGTREEIARGVAGFQLEYYDGLDWYDEWGDPENKARKQSATLEKPNTTGLPEAVRITLWLEPPSSRKRERSPEEKVEAPLVFQTVVRLNLAAVSLIKNSSGAGTKGTPSTPQNGAINPDGGPAQ
jgi:type II secretion system protein J